MNRNTIALYPFHYFDLARRRWYRARYVAQINTIAERYAAFQIVGPPEVRKGVGASRFTPFR